MPTLHRMPEDDLYSKRHGRARRLDYGDFADLVWRRIRDLRAQGYFDEAVGPRGLGSGGRLTPDDFLRRLHQPDIYMGVREGISDWLGSTSRAPLSCRALPDVLFDTLEFLHAEAVSQPSQSKDDAQAAFRATLNPELALHDPPMEFITNGHVVEMAPSDLQPLLDEPIPDDVPTPLRDPLRDAIAQFRQRGATDHDKRTALKHLADVLEPMRREIKQHLLQKDESAIFHIANEFWIRHNNRNQKRNYDGVWLDWTFYVYVATARALLSVIDRQTLIKSVYGDEPNAEPETHQFDD
jgi:hypothetical protein